MKIKLLLILGLFFASLNAATIETLKDVYSPQQKVKVTLTEMPGAEKDWVGIYPEGASNAWGNVKSWRYTNGINAGEITLDKLPVGKYEARVFFNNTFNLEDNYAFSVEGANQNVVLTTNKDVYSINDDITVNFDNMEGNAQDWIGLYKAGTSNAWANVLSYHFTDGRISGQEVWNPLPVGDYEVRAFFNNTYNLEGTKAFSVKGGGAQANVATAQDDYSHDDVIVVNFNNMTGGDKDWIGIYPAGSSNAWGNVVAWKYTGGDENGAVSLGQIPAGDYQARAFFNNSYNLEASYDFSVSDENGGGDGVALNLNKDEYVTNELIYVNYKNMQGNDTDWIGIYPAGSNYEFKNVLDWRSTNGNINGELSLGTNVKGTKKLGSLPVGDYEVRAFFNNSLHIEVVQAFSVVQKNVTFDMYEAVNGGISPDWIHVSGPFAAVYSAPYVRFQANWVTATTNRTEFVLPFDPDNTTKKFLEVDIGGSFGGHFSYGVHVNTLNGTRRLLWDSFLDHSQPNPPKAFKDGDWLSFSSPIENLNAGHVKVNVEQYLRILEPDNKITAITGYFTTGGYHSNIKLSSH